MSDSRPRRANAGSKMKELIQQHIDAGLLSVGVDTETPTTPALPLDSLPDPDFCFVGSLSNYIYYYYLISSRGTRYHRL